MFTELDIRVIPGGKYQLLAPLTWRGLITVPLGFVTDFASVPRGFRWLITGHDETRKPAVLHDYLYSMAAGNRLDADRSFRLALRDTNTPAWKRELAYRAVRIGGWFVWNKYAKLLRTQETAHPPTSP